MAVDPEYLRRQYASLSDDALLDVNPDELVPAARECLMAELDRRQIEAPTGEFVVEVDEELEPDWVEEGSEVYSGVVRKGADSMPQAHDARVALQSAGIPCFIDVYEEEPVEEPLRPQPVRRWRVLVPGELNLVATGVIQRDMLNDDFEAGWRTHLEVLSDDEVRDLDPRQVFCGIYDQVERISRAYNEELKRRGLS